MRASRASLTAASALAAASAFSFAACAIPSTPAVAPRRFKTPATAVLHFWCSTKTSTRRSSSGSFPLNSSASRSISPSTVSVGRRLEHVALRGEAGLAHVVLRPSREPGGDARAPEMVPVPAHVAAEHLSPAGLAA
eukprot:30835-Pelagococcus_subviridis.AAC.27